ncbi:MAG: hypothetical protein QNK49_05605 [Porticoccus sp.]
MSDNMGTAIIELNDSGHCCRNSKGEVFVSPGYAFLTNKGIDTGDIARLKSYLSPQQSFNQFWRQLSLSPLAHSTSKVRHNGDLAFQQLLDLHKELGHPNEVIFAIPGSFDREQLSIILGLIQATPFKSIGFVDSAVAAVSQLKFTEKSNSKKYLVHLDIQLHQIVFTRLLVSEHYKERVHVEVVPDVGLKNFYDDWAKYIANKFIQECRYDPLHTAKGEQQLYNLLPGWIKELCAKKEVTIVLDSPQGNYQLILNLDDLLTRNNEKIAQLKQKFSAIVLEGDLLFASHRTRLLPGLTEQLGKFHILPENSAVLGCLQHLNDIKQDHEDIFLVTKIANQDLSAVEEFSQSPENTPTHVLYQNTALAIGKILYISTHGTLLAFSQGRATKTFLSYKNGNVYLTTKEIDLAKKHQNNPLRIGESIAIRSQSFQLIEVI